MDEIFESEIVGKICLRTHPFCKGCTRFQPTAYRSLKTDGDGHLIFDEHGHHIYDGIYMRCEYSISCEGIMRNLAERMREENA